MAHTLYLDQDQITLSNQNATLNLASKDGATQKIPLNGLKKLVVKGNNTLTARLLAKLGALGIGLIAISGQQHEPTLFLPNIESDVHLRIQQILIFQKTNIALGFSRFTIQEKVSQQIQLLTAHDNTPHALHRYAIKKAIAQLKAIQQKIGLSDDSQQLMGYEGATSAIYFRCLSHLVADDFAFRHRNTRPTKDPFNVLLSLSYSLLTSEIALALHIKGLDPYIGYYHSPVIGRASLACDLIEPLRPWVDLFCLQLCRSQTLRTSHFKTNAHRCVLERAGRLKFYEAWESQAEQRNQQIQQQINWVSEELKRHEA